LPRYCESRIYEVLADALTAEHSTRMMAMNNASNNCEELIDTLIGFDWAREPDLRETLLHILNRVAPRVGTVRALGSAALGPCYVAAGWLDAYFHIRLSPWDAAAGTVIVREAGGVATDFDGHPWRLTSSRFLCTSSVLHSKMVALIGQAMGSM